MNVASECVMAFTPPQLEFLPQKYVFQSGIRATLRNMRTDEDVILYEMMVDAMENGTGYGMNEYPTLAVFRGERVKQGRCCVFEQENTGRIMGYVFVFDSSINRSRGTRVSRSLLVISKEFRGKKYGVEMSGLGFGLATDLGYRYALNNTTVCNKGAVNITHQILPESSFVGTLQKGGYFQGKGWVDMLIIAHDNERDIKSFKRLVEENVSWSKI